MKWWGYGGIKLIEVVIESVHTGYLNFGKTTLPGKWWCISIWQLWFWFEIWFQNFVFSRLSSGFIRQTEWTSDGFDEHFLNDKSDHYQAESQGQRVPQVTESSEVLGLDHLRIELATKVPEDFTIMEKALVTTSYKFWHFDINVVWFSNQQPMVTQKDDWRWFFWNFSRNCLLTPLILRERKVVKNFRFRWCFVNCF